MDSKIIVTILFSKLHNLSRLMSFGKTPANPPIILIPYLKQIWEHQAWIFKLGGEKQLAGPTA
jgi:hypothetical protein